MKSDIEIAQDTKELPITEIAKKVDYMIIIGGKKSSNTNKLYEISQKYCKKAIKIETAKELNNEDFSNIEKIGVMAGASTPKESIDEVIDYLNKV